MNKSSDDCDSRLPSYVCGPPSPMVGPLARSRQACIELEIVEALLAIFLPEEKEDVCIDVRPTFIAYTFVAAANNIRASKEKPNFWFRLG